MAKKVLRKDIIEENPFLNLIKSADQARKTVQGLEKDLKNVKKQATASKSSGGISPTNVKGLAELNAKQKQANDLATKKLLIDKNLIKEKQRIAELNKKQNAALKDEVLLMNKNLGTLEKIKVKNRQLRNEREKLNLSTKKGANRLKIINRQLDINNKIIDKNSDKMKKQRLNVGNYTSAIGKLRGGLMQLGLGFGVFSILKNAFSTVKDFEQGQADLASVLGITTDQMKGLTDQAKELGATTTFTATQVSELQKEYAKLGFTQSEIENVTEATLLLAEATGTELGRAAEVTGATLRGFGLDSTETQRVVDVMAKSFSSSSLDMEKFATGMAAVAPVAKNMGFSIEETTALLGTLTDRGIDASSAGTGLRNMFLDATKNGMTLEEALAEINGATDKTSKSFELFGKRGATLGVILAENGSSVDELSAKLLDADGAAEKMADTQRNTLGGALKLLQSAWDGFILKMNEAGGAGDKLRKGVVFLADNLETIVTWIGHAIKAFIAFKVAMTAMKLADKVKDWRAFNKEVKKTGKNATEAKSGVKGFGQALKGIGFAVAISLVIEFAKGLYDVASGAMRARYELDLFNKSINHGSVEAQKFISKNEELLRQKTNEINLSEMSREEKDKAIKQETEEAKLRTKNKIIRLNELKEVAKQEKQDAINRLEAERKIVAAGGRGLQEQALLKATGSSVSMSKIQNELATARAEIKGLNSALTDLNVSYDTLGQTVIDYTIEQQESDKTTTDSNKVLKEQISLIRQTEDVNISTISDEKKRQDAELKINAKRRIEDLEGVEADTVEKAELIKAINYKLKLDLEKLWGNKKGLLGPPDASGIDAETDAIVITPEVIVGEEEKAKHLADVLHVLDDIADQSLAEAIRRSKAKQDLIQEEIEASKELTDTLREGAKTGNAIASESLALQEKITEEKIKLKRKEANREKALAEAKAIYNIFVNALENGDNVVKSASKSLSAKAFFNALPTFFKGTKGRLGEERTADFSGKDGHVVRVDDSEMILNGGLVDNLASVGITSTQQAVESAVLYEQLALGNSNGSTISQLNTLSLEKEIQTLTEVVKNKTETSFHPLFRNGLLAGVTEQHKNGNRVKRYHKKMNS